MDNVKQSDVSPKIEELREDLTSKLSLLED